MKLQRLTEAEVLTIRQEMSQLLIAKSDFFGAASALYPEKLSAAVHRQGTSLRGVYKYNTIHELGASLFYGLNMAHPFENGNKRTALVALLVLIDKNNCVLRNTTEDELYDLATQLANHTLPIAKGRERNAESEVAAVASWLRPRLAGATGDRHMKFSELRRSLENLGCSFDKPDQNYVVVRNGTLKYRTGYPRHDFEIDVQEIKRIRRALKLDRQHGMSSQEFYDVSGGVDRFVKFYAKLMRRLADT